MHLKTERFTPIYDVFFNHGPFLRARKKIFNSIPFHLGNKVLFVGVGTGADIEQIPYNMLDVTAIDFSNDMLNKAKGKFGNTSIKLLQMDAQELLFPSNTYDYVVGSLILTVVPDGSKAIKEMVRVTKPGGHIIIFDKFTPKGKQLNFIKKLLRPIILLMGTDIGISFEKLSFPFASEVEIKEDKEILYNGMYRKILIQKNNQIFVTEKSSESML